MPNQPIANSLTRPQQSLLTFLETCAVDHHGRVNRSHMNEADAKQAAEWHQSHFITYRRILSAEIIGSSSMAVSLSDNAWTLAAAARKDRALRDPISPDKLTDGLPRNPEATSA